MLFALKHPKHSLNQRRYCHQCMCSSHQMCSAQLLEGLLSRLAFFIAFLKQSATSYCCDLFLGRYVGCYSQQQPSLRQKALIA